MIRRAAFAALLALAACQQVPHPFADINATPALRPPDSAGIIVLPVRGAPAAEAAQIAAALADALRKADVPASTDAANRASFRLAAAVAPESGAAMTLDWRLEAPGGAALGQGSVRAPAAPEPALATALGSAAAPAIVRLVEGDAPLPAHDADPLLRVSGVSGAPGDGDRALARAIDTALRRASIEVADAGDGQARYTLAGYVALSPPLDGKQQVTVRWTLSRAAGGQLGQVSQQNAVPAGSLDANWGDVAYAVAMAAAPGIADLLERARKAPAGG